MKKVIICVLSIAVIIGMIFFTTTAKSNEDYLRIHIRANSNSAIDQRVKYQVKDRIVDALIPLLADCESKQESEIIIEKNFPLIESVANSVLRQNGFYYSAKAKLSHEEFPTRSYEGFVLEKGFYDALILELGDAKGDNWWCVVYPPLCFVNGSCENVVYKSRIVEIIKKVLG